MRRFTSKQLAEFSLPGYPTTSVGWDKLLARKGWEFIEEKGRGRGGIRREYTPPPDVMALIEARQRGEIGEGDVHGGHIPDKKTGKKRYFAEAPERPYVIRAPIESGGPIRAEYAVPSGEWMMLSAIAINEADWLPEMSQKEKIDLGLRLFSLITMLLGADDKKLNLLMDNNVALQAMLRVAYEVSKIDEQVSIAEKNTNKGA